MNSTHDKQLITFRSSARVLGTASDRLVAIHECGHALVGHLRQLHVVAVQLANIGGTVVEEDQSAPPPGLLDFFYAGLCAEIEFGYSLRVALDGCKTDLLLASTVFPGHNPAPVLARTRSLVRYHKDTITRVARELMTHGHLARADLLRLMRTA